MEAYLNDDDVGAGNKTANDNDQQAPTSGANSADSTVPSDVNIDSIHPKFPQFTKIFGENPGFEKVVDFVKSELDSSLAERNNEESKVRGMRDKMELEFLKSASLLEELESFENLQSGNGLVFQELQDEICFQHSKQLLPFFPSARENPNESRTLRSIEGNTLDDCVSNVLGIQQLRSLNKTPTENFHQIIPLLESKLKDDRKKLCDFIKVFQKEVNQGKNDAKLEEEEEKLIAEEVINESKHGRESGNGEDLAEYLGITTAKRKPKRRTRSKRSTKVKKKVLSTQKKTVSSDVQLDVNRPKKQTPLCRNGTKLDLEQVLRQGISKKSNLSQQVQTLKKDYASSFLNFFNIVSETVRHLVLFTEKFYVGQVKGIKTEVDHRLLRKRCLQDKLKALDFEFVGRTYKREKVVALKEIRRHINTRLQSLQSEVMKLQKEVNSYGSLDVGFGEYVDQYAEIQRKIKAVEYHLKQFEE